MSEELRPDDPATAPPAPSLQREAYPPRRDRWLMPLIAAGCSLAGVAVGFVLGQHATSARASGEVAMRMPEAERLRAPDFDDDMHGPGRFFAFNWHGHEGHGLLAPIPPIPPLPPMAPRQLIVDGCGDDDEGCTTIVKRKADGSMVIVKTRK